MQTVADDGGNNDLNSVKSQKRRNADRKGFQKIHTALCLIVNDDEPDCSEDVAGKQTDRHRNCHHPQLASELVIRQTYDQSGGKKTDNVTAGRTDQGRKSAFEISKHRNADRAEQNVNEHADRSSFRTKQTAC